MKTTGNETYLANMSAYVHLLSDNELNEEIKKIRALKTDKSKKKNHHIKNRIIINETTHMLNKI